MLRIKLLCTLVISMFTLTACETVEDVYYQDDTAELYANQDTPTCETSFADDGEEITLCKYGKETAGAWTYEQKNSFETYTPKLSNNINTAGTAFCPPQQRCNGNRLPPRPCIQPIPRYYDNIAQKTLENAVILIHPYTRAQAVCYDNEYGSRQALDCVNHFRARGFALITDLPQLPAKYDFLRRGTYPTRRWRDGGEVVPRW